MTRLQLFAGAAALTLLAGCGEQAPPPINITTVEVDDNSSVMVPGDNAAEPADNATDGNAVAAKPALSLASDGLTLVLETGATRQASFGMARDTVVTMVSAALGTPDISKNGDCGQGPMDMADFAGGLSAQFQDGKFVGWDVDGREKGGFTTMNGIGVGSTLKELRGAFSGVKVETSTLGEEFTAGDLGGLLTSQKPEGKITHIWAGSTCQFR